MIDTQSRPYARIDRDFVRGGRGNFASPFPPNRGESNRPTTPPGYRRKSRKLTPLLGTPPLLGDAEPVRAVAAPSGRSLGLRPRGIDGDFIPILSVQSGNAVQAFAPSRTTVSGSFTLSFGGQTTASIAFVVNAPTKSATFLNMTVTPGTAYQISATVEQAVGLYAREVFCELIEGTTVVATAIFNQDNIASDPNVFTLSNTQNGGAGVSYFVPIFPSYTPVGSSLSLRMTAPATSNPSTQPIWVADALQVKEVISGTAALYDSAFPDGSHFSAVGNDGGSAGGFHQHFDGSYSSYLFGTGEGSTYTINASEVKSKFEALSSVGFGNTDITVTSNGGISIEFVGTLGAQAVGDVTSSNSAIVFNRIVGGYVPTFHVTHLGGGTTDIVCRQKWIPGDNATIDWILYFLDGVHIDTTILPTDLLTVTIPNSPTPWAMTTEGPMASGTFSVENCVGGTMIQPFVVAPKMMEVGQGIQPDEYYSECLMYNNMASRCGTQHVAPLGGSGPFLEWDDDGDPTLMVSDGALAIVTQAPQGSHDGVGGILPLNAPNGKYTIYFDDPDDSGMGLGGQNTAFTEDMSYRQRVGTTSRRVVDVQANQSINAAPWITWTWQSSGPADGNGNFPCATKNLRIYPPDPSDPTGMTPWLDPTTTATPIFPFDPTGVFHPSYLRKLATCRVIRPMQALDTLYNALANFSEYKPVNWLDRSQPAIIRRVNVQEIRQYAGAALDNPHSIVFQIATVEPHGFTSGQSVTLEECGTATFSDARFPDARLGEHGDIGISSITVIDDHTFGFHGMQTKLPDNVNVNGVTMTNVLTKGDPIVGGGVLNGAARVSIGTSVPIEEMVYLVNLLKTLYPDVPRCLWFNVSAAATDACMDSVSSYVATHLASGVTCRAEFGNECWNFNYATYGWMRIKNFQIFSITDDTYAKAYSFYQVKVNSKFQAAFNAAGRGSDFVHVFAVQTSGTANTGLILQYALSQGASCDEVCIAPYVSSYNPDPFDTDRANAMPPEMHVDALEFNTDNPGYSYTAANRTVIDEFYPNAKIVTYEGGWESLILGLTGKYYLYSNLWMLQHAINRHPRMFAITLRLLQSYQDEGISLFTWFFLYGGSQYQAWSTWNWWDQLPGTGDPSENPDYRDTSAVTDNPVKSQVAGAIDYWNSLVGAVTTPLAPGTATAGSVSNTTATATATDATGGTTPFAHQWHRSLVFGQTGNPVVGQTGLSLSDAGLTSGTPYYYRLKYTDDNGAGSSVFSNQIAMTTTGGGSSLAPGIVIAGSVTTTTATATASDATGGTSPFAYQWFRSQVLGQHGNPVGGQTTRNLSDVGLAPSTTYYYSMRYADANGAGSQVYSNQIGMTTQSVPVIATGNFSSLSNIRMLKNFRLN